MDFFKHQKQARKESKKLFALFVVAMVLVLIVTVAVILPAAHYLLNGEVFEVIGPSEEPDYFHLTTMGAKVFASVCAFVFLTVGGGFLLKLMEMGEGGKAIADMLGAVRLEHSDLSPEQKRELQNINEEMGIASGIRPPTLYIINDYSINALAAGMEIRDSIICLTTGAAKELNRVEMSALIAHEYGHILGCDARTNMYFSAVLHGLMMFTIMGKKLFRSRYNIGYPNILLGFFLMLVGFIGSSIGKLIQSFYSQEREFLADACAVQFTRSKEGILGAFQQVWYRRFHNKMKSAYAMEVAHFMFTSSTATHPGLRERAYRVDARFRFRNHRPEEYQPSSVRPLTPKGSTAGHQKTSEELMDILLKSSSFSPLLNFSLLHFATLAIKEHRYQHFKALVIEKANTTENMAFKFRMLLVHEFLSDQYSLIKTAKLRLPLPRRTRALPSLEVEHGTVFSALIEGTNQDHGPKIRSLFKETFPWSSELPNAKTIEAESFHRSFNMLVALDIDSKKIIHDFIQSVIRIDGRVSYEEDEFFKLLCTRLNMTLPG